MCALCVDLLELYRMRKCSWSNVSRIVQISSKLAEVTFGYRRGASDVAVPGCLGQAPSLPCYLQSFIAHQRTRWPMLGCPAAPCLKVHLYHKGLGYFTKMNRTGNGEGDDSVLTRRSITAKTPKPCCTSTRSSTRS
jgi:hypothetical protein